MYFGPASGMLSVARASGVQMGLHVAITPVRRRAMPYLTLPLFHELEPANSILLAGAGGGFDLFSGLPLYFALRGQGKQVHLANVSFTPLQFTTGRSLGPALYEVEAT